MQPTERQRQALRKLNGYDNVLLYGGARSGKTFITCAWLIKTALVQRGARIIVARRYATDVRASVWKQTLPEVLRLNGLHNGSDYTSNEQDMELKFGNGSVLGCAGLDDKERVDKILGREYLVMYINESQDVLWPTVKTLLTRLSQRVEGFRPKFIADLNPTSVAHWTYKLWFDRRDPESGNPVAGSYGCLQMNPLDNAGNLAEGYIESKLATLTGEARSRFFLGEYSTNSDLQVFHPVALYSWAEFTAWGEGRWPDVRLIGGLDLGVDDPDAFAILAYVNGDSDVWLLYEHMARRQGVAELADAIRTGMDWAFSNVPTPEKRMEIWSDTNTIRHGKEGDAKKNARMLAEIYGLPCRPAYKRDKVLGIEFLRDDVNTGRLHIPHGGAFADECAKTVWTRNPVDGAIIREIDDEAFHPNMMDAIVYPYRYLMSYGNTAMIGRARTVAHDTTNTDEFVRDMHEALGETSRVW